jgi:hypothetical protein
MNRRGFTHSLTGLVGAFVAGSRASAATTTPKSASLARAQARLSPTKVTKIRVFYPPNYNPNGPQTFPQSNMVVLVDTEARGLPTSPRDRCRRDKPAATAGTTKRAQPKGTT